MKKNITIIALLCLSVGLFGRDKDALSLFETDRTWAKEIIAFPLGFARDIKFEGFEDLRFPTGWAKKASPEFWSYIWACKINASKALTESELETNIQFYFDGLMGLDFKGNRQTAIAKIKAIFIKKDTSLYIGKVKTFDTRFTNKPMTLHAIAEQQYCEK